jgi:hypothetical protein
MRARWVTATRISDTLSRDELINKNRASLAPSIFDSVLTFVRSPKFIVRAPIRASIRAPSLIR